ncbi:MAG: hypothetical protein ACRCR1_00175 [Aeromonas sp.]
MSQPFSSWCKEHDGGEFYQSVLMITLCAAEVVDGPAVQPLRWFTVIPGVDDPSLCRR